MCRICQVSLVIVIAIWQLITSAGQRRFWVHPFLSDRSTKGFENYLLPSLLNNQFFEGDHVSFKSYFRMTYRSFQHLCELLEPRLSGNLRSLRTDTITAREKVAVTLRYLATGNSYRSLELQFLISSKTIQKIVIEVCDSINEVLGPIYMKIPSTEDEWREIARRFQVKKQFPHCIGAIDGKHIRIIGPNHPGSNYWNYKGFNSLVLLGIADSRNRFIWAECGIEGRFSDGGVLSRSDFKKYLDQGLLNLPAAERGFPFFFIGDDAFPISIELLKPYKERCLSAIQKLFNNLLTSTRVVIENAFGVLVARFRVLAKRIDLLPENVKKVTMACCILHNMLIDELSEEQVNSGWREVEQELELVPVKATRSAGNGTNEGRRLRDRLAEAFWSKSN